MLSIVAMVALQSGDSMGVGGQAAQELTVVTAHDRRLPMDGGAEVASRLTFASAVLGHLYEKSSRQDFRSSILEPPRWDGKLGGSVLTIKAGTTFHDGRRVTSDDIAYGILRWLFSPKADFMRCYLHALDGVDELVPGRAYSVEAVRGLRILDSERILVRSRNGSESFVKCLTSPLFSPVPRDALLEDHITWRGLPVGAGQYRVESIDPQQCEVVLVATDACDGVGRVVLSSSPGECSADVYLGALPSCTEPSSYAAANLGGFDYVNVVCFNFNSPLGKDIRFRQSIAAVVDRIALAGNQRTAVPVWDLLPPELWWQADREDASPDRAREMLAPIAGAVAETKFSIQAPPLACLRELQLQLRQIGIDVHFIPRVDKILPETDKETPFFVCPLGMSDIVDPILNFYLFGSRGVLPNCRPPEDEQYDRLLLEAQSRPSVDALFDALRRVSDHFKRSVYAVPILASRSVVHISVNRIATLGQQTGAIDFNLASVRVK